MNKTTSSPDDTLPPRSRKRPLAVLGIWIGGILTLSPLWGMVVTVVGMMNTFEALTVDGRGDARALSQGIGTALRGTEVGFLICPLGIAILVCSIVGLHPKVVVRS